MKQRKHRDVRLRRPDRTQMRMQTVCPDDLIPADHPARMIWAATGKLDLSRFYTSIQAVSGRAGRNATDPRLLVALWLYACVRGIGSGRELARQCEENAAFRWLCGSVTVNYHLLCDFRTAHADALDELFTQVLGRLLHQKLVKVERISQDGTRVRACVGAASFRRRETLETHLRRAQKHVKQLRALLDDPAASAELSARQKAAQERAAREKVARLERALEQMPVAEAKRAEQAKKLSKKDREAGKEPKAARVSTTDATTQVMKMPGGGYRPGVNVQLACDTSSRAIVGVYVTGEGTDVGQSEPMRQQVQQRTGQKVREHLVDGGYLKLDDIEQAAGENVDIYCPPKPPRNRDLRGSEYDPRESDSQAVAAWRKRMGSEDGQAIYRQRASTIETINGDLKTYRGLTQLTVRGDKARCVALWCALAYNLLHFGAQLFG